MGPFGGVGERRCRAAFGAGGYCEFDAQCRGSLRCAPAYYSGRESEERRCFDLKKPLARGALCSPEAGWTGRRCVSFFEKRSYGWRVRPMRCLKDLKGVFRCQVVAGLFERCAPKSNVACGDAILRCGRSGVCVEK